MPEKNEKPTPEVSQFVAETKQFRKDLDEILQRLKVASGLANTPPMPTADQRGSRERILAITMTEEAIRWLGMDLYGLKLQDEMRSAFKRK